MSENIVTLSDADFENDVLKSSMPVLVDFWAEWCAPCRMLAPTVEAIAQQYIGRLKVGKLNVDENMSTSMKYKVQGIPTLLLFKNGQVAAQLVGNQPKAVIQQMVERTLNS